MCEVVARGTSGACVVGYAEEETRKAKTIGGQNTIAACLTAKVNNICLCRNRNFASIFCN